MKPKSVQKADSLMQLKNKIQLKEEMSKRLLN